ncbi:Guanylate kinase [Heracleum sosnowskyi]|uniref:Guanylate kinase n=1 Tax=Heracleum sosnowskyi TaxID=360622 RepID=A0AAD8I6B4_9APIA|nr:Guanylate kinase [Heracleum sosnowskyi]
MRPTKILPFDSQAIREVPIRSDGVKPVLKSRLMRLFDRQFRVSSTEKPIIGTEAGKLEVGNGAELFEPSSVCLTKMVQNFIEDSSEKQLAQKCGRNRCNCFNGIGNDSSDDEFDVSTGFGDDLKPKAWYGDFSDTIKNLIQCATVTERNLLADTSNIVEKHKICKQKDDLRRILTDELVILGYNASICKSRWEKSALYPAGEYEYIDVLVDGEERILIDIDFKSEFEIARPTSNYKTILQSLPYIYVGKADRLKQVVSIISEAAKQSLKKKGMHIPPWRKAEYMRAKWLSSYTRTTASPNESTEQLEKQGSVECECGELDLIFGSSSLSSEKSDGGDEKSTAVMSPWQPPAVKPKSCERGGKAVVTGLACLFKEKA